MRASTSEEMERPAEWLGTLSDGGLYGALVEGSGGLAVAAYRLARARGRVYGVSSCVPTLREVVVAATALADAAGTPLPPSDVLLDECTDAGCVVIAPI